MSSLPYKIGRREDQEGRKIQVCGPRKLNHTKERFRLMKVKNVNPSALDTIYLVKTCL